MSYNNYEKQGKKDNKMKTSLCRIRNDEPSKIRNDCEKSIPTGNV